jgi:carboxymethylenebutenolidase
MIEFARPDGGKTMGYLATAGQGRPGIIVIQEWWGLNDQICGVADRFARAGYNALAPDLYKGRLTTQPDEANHLMTGLDFAGATHQDLRGVAQHLQAQSGKGSGDGLLHGRCVDHCCHCARPGICCGGVRLRDPAEGLRRPGRDPCAVAGTFR